MQCSIIWLSIKLELVEDSHCLKNCWNFPVNFHPHPHSPPPPPTPFFLSWQKFIFETIFNIITHLDVSKLDLLLSLLFRMYNASGTHSRPKIMHHDSWAPCLNCCAQNIMLRSGLNGKEDWSFNMFPLLLCHTMVPCFKDTSANSPNNCSLPMPELHTKASNTKDWHRTGSLLNCSSCPLESTTGPGTEPNCTAAREREVANEILSVQLWTQVI